jgi:hypothetical protein
LVLPSLSLGQALAPLTLLSRLLWFLSLTDPQVPFIEEFARADLVEEFFVVVVVFIFILFIYLFMGFSV